MTTTIIAKFRQAIWRLEEALAVPASTVARDAAIQRFEFTFELAWKATQKFLGDEGIVCQSPRSCLEQAFALGLVADDPRWLDVLDDRNLTVHTYDEKLAQAVHSRLPGHVIVFRGLLNALEERAPWSS